MFYKYTLFFCLTLLGYQLSGSTSDIAPLLKEYTETIKKDFNFTTASPDVLLSNRYGDIDITTTEGTQATVEVTIMVESSNDGRAQKILDAIDIEIDADNNSLDVETEINNNNGWNFTKRNESYKIYYKISIPKKSTLTVVNRYGDISVTELENDLDLELKYGNGQIQGVNGDVSFELGYVKQFIVGNITGDAEIEISYSNMEMNDAKDVEIESKYSDINMGTITSLNMESKYDEYRIEEVGKLKNEGKYDKIKIGSVNDFFTETKYTHISIQKLNKKGTFYTGYGSVAIDELSNEFDRITIESKYTGYKVNTTAGYAISVDTEYTDVDLDDLEISYRDKDSNELRLKGTKKGPGKGIIEANMRYGKLRIRD